MFECQHCASHEFTLATAHALHHIEVSLNHAHEVVIKVDGHKPFVADTKFMNQFAQCKQCQATQCWQPSQAPKA